MAFEKLSEKLRETVKKRGFIEPTLPQKMAIEPILSGENVLLIAETGTGKTESSMIPIFDLWLEKKPAPISILYITPLKSLNRDMLRRLLWWGKELDMDISVRHGDTSAYARKLQAEIPPDCLILTPETLQAILPAKKMKEHLRNVKWVIVDEVHEIANSKRGVQLAVGLERLRQLSGDFQLIALSATIGEPQKIADFISGSRKMKILKAITAKEMTISVINPSPIKTDRKIAGQLFISPEAVARLRTVRDLIEKHTSTLTFANTRDFAEVLTSRLKQVYPSLKIENHHSSLSKNVRIKTEEDFKKQKLKSIVCTSSLQLGIDIGSVDLTLQYQSPRQVSQLIQRVGRSGHELGRISKGIIVTTNVDDIFESAVIAKQSLSEQLEDLKVHENALDVLAHQIVGMTRDGMKNLNEIYSLVKKSYPYRNLDRNDFLTVCKQLNQTKYIFLYDDEIKLSRKGLLYYFENLSMIPDVRSYWVVNSITNERVGTLDESFVALHAVDGATFIIKGEPWRILTIDGRRIFVEPSGDVEAAIPGWEGELMPVPFSVAQEVGALRESILNENRIGKEYPIDKIGTRKMINIVRKQSEYGVVPTDKKLLIENDKDTVIIHACFGSLVNETLGRFLSSILANRLGSVGLKTDPYRIILRLQKMDLELIKEVLFKTTSEVLEPFLDMSLSNSRLFEWKFIHVAKRFGIIRKDAEYGKGMMKKIMGLYSGTPVWREVLRELKTEKLDIEKAKKVLRDIQDKKIEVIFKKELSPIGKMGLKERLELVGTGKADIQVLEVFKNRLLNKRIRLVCLNCGEWTQTVVVDELPEEIRCGKCKAKLIGVVRPDQLDYRRIVKKKLKDSGLTMEEEKILERISRTSDLIIVYGRKAIEALAARGVGPQTATRILAKMYTTKDDFYKELLNAERRYVMTRKFW